MKRGTLCWINLEDSSPPEFGKIRPGVIVSNSQQNELLPTVAVVPLSTRPPQIWPLRLELKFEVASLGQKKSFAVIPGIRQVSKTRLEGTVGVVPPALMDEVTKALSVYLND